MKGATTEPCVAISKPPRISITKIIGANQIFFLDLKNSQSSFIINLSPKIDFYNFPQRKFQFLYISNVFGVFSFSNTIRHVKLF